MIRIKDIHIKKHNVDIKIEKLDIGRSGIYQFIGPNGSGKTTILKYLVKECKLEKVSYLPQEITLLENLSINDNIKIFSGKGGLNRKLDEYLIINNKEEIIRNLSGGEKRKVQLAITLSSAKPLIILDEPFNHVDDKTVNWLNSYITSLSDEKIILIVDHSNVGNFKKINITEPINFEVRGNIDQYCEKISISYWMQLKNMQKTSKVIYSITLIMLMLFLLAVSCNNKLNNFTYQFTNQQVAQTVESSLCPENNSSFSGETDSKLSNLEDPTFVTLPLDERIPLSRDYVFYKREYPVDTIKMVTPKEQVVAYDGPLKIYDLYKVVVGELPDDYSNQVAIPLYYARSIQHDRNLDSVDDVVGEKVIINGYDEVVSGVIVSDREVAGHSVISSYDGYDYMQELGCNPLLNGVEKTSNITKLLKITVFAILINLILSAIIAVVERTSFQTYRLLMMRNKILLSYTCVTIACVVGSLIYYFNMP